MSQMPKSLQRDLCRLVLASRLDSEISLRATWHGLTQKQASAITKSNRQHIDALAARVARQIYRRVKGGER